MKSSSKPSPRPHQHRTAVHAELDETSYPTGVKIPNGDIKAGAHGAPASCARWSPEIRQPGTRSGGEVRLHLWADPNVSSIARVGAFSMSAPSHFRVPPSQRTDDAVRALSATKSTPTGVGDGEQRDQAERQQHVRRHHGPPPIPPIDETPASEPRKICGATPANSTDPETSVEPVSA